MDWFEDWFNTSYYHILYKNRNYQEAQDFLSHLLTFLKIPKNAYILDLACGKGRHSIFLNKLGYNILGIDLAEHSIKIAKEHENARLKFLVGDMRKVYFPNTFDLILNLFTSFGYFNNLEDNITTYQAVNKQLKKDGIFIMDYMNSCWVSDHLIPNEIKVIDNISFHINRKIENNFVIKNIHFKDKGREYNFQEKVYLCGIKYFEELADQTGFTIEHAFGNYHLTPFDPKNSQRLILILKKIND